MSRWFHHDREPSCVLHILCCTVTKSVFPSDSRCLSSRSNTLGAPAKSSTTSVPPQSSRSCSGSPGSPWKAAEACPEEYPASQLASSLKCQPDLVFSRILAL
eukprot:1996059-Rhodomonas_salina.4